MYYENQITTKWEILYIFKVSSVCGLYWHGAYHCV